MLYHSAASMGKAPRNILLAFIVLSFLALLAPATLKKTGVYINEPGWSVAKIAAEENNVGVCQRIFFMPWKVASPSTEEQRRACIHDYASLTHDPTACELLMPSEYGFSCIGTARVKEPCGFGYYANPRVQGNGIIATLEECISGPPEIRANACCAIAKVKYTDDHNDCSVLIDATRELQDQCHHELALKSRDISECSSIQNINVRSSCEIHVKYL